MKIEWLDEGWGNCPVQAEGVVDLENGERLSFYFRARHSGWSLKTAPEGNDAVAGFEVASGATIGIQSAGWLDHGLCRRLIESLFEVFSCGVEKKETADADRRAEG